MDKLRAIQYFNRAAEDGSFAAAARFFEVSTSAITQLVGALERSLGVTLLHRSRQGISLTSDGERYYETARRIATDLYDVEEQLGPRGAKPRGTLAFGMNSTLGPDCVMPRVARFLARYPDIELIFRPIVNVREIEEKKLDVAVLVGWPPERDLIVRPLAQTRLIVCASPEYWKRERIPHEPEALREHQSLVIRGSEGTLLDRWIFERNGERRIIDVKTRLFCDYGAGLVEAACAGAGVIRLANFRVDRYLSSGLLFPVLTDWEALEAPMIYAAYAPGRRHSKLLRVFLDFLAEVFAELESERGLSPGSAMQRVPPEWFGRAHGRHSAYAARRRKPAA